MSFNKETITEAIKEVLTESTLEISTTDGTEKTASSEQKERIKKARLAGTMISFRKKGDTTPMREDHHENPNDDSDMAKSQLYAIAKYAMELLQMIKDGDPLDAWVQAKITKAADYIDAVQHYLEGEEFLDANQEEPEEDLDEARDYQALVGKEVMFGSRLAVVVGEEGDYIRLKFEDGKENLVTKKDFENKQPGVNEDDDVEAPATGFEDDSAKAPKGDKKLNKAASKNDKIISTYKKIKPLFKKAAAGDKEALAIVKANQDVIKAYRKLTQTHLAENKATCCGKCGRTHVKGTECKKPFLTGQDHCRVR
jgi:hypothetical protein